MKTKNRILSLLIMAVFLTGIIGMVGCTPVEETGTPADTPTTTDDETTVEADPFGVYDPPITLTAAINEDPIRVAPEEMSLSDNPWQEKFNEYGITVEYPVRGSNQEDLETKINLAIATGDLPDVFTVTPAQFQELLEADMLEDLTDVYDNYLSDEAAIWVEQVDPELDTNVIVDGRRYGLIYPIQYDDFVPVVSIRQDWLDELELDAPETVEDVWEIARAFKDNNMDGTCDIGIGLTMNLFDMLTPSLGLLNCYGAYYDIWMEDGGELINSTIQPGMKNALAKLRSYFEEGLIDPEFGSKDAARMMEDAIAGRSGVVISHFIAPFEIAPGKNLGQEWTYHTLVPEDGSVTKAQNTATFTGALVVRKGAQNPEAAIKLINLFARYTNAEPSINDDGKINFCQPFVFGEMNQNPKIHKYYMQYLETGEHPPETEGFSVYWNTIEQVEMYSVDGNLEGYPMWAIFGPEGTERVVAYHLENDGYILSEYTGAPTDGMSRYNANLRSMAEQMATYIITGDRPVDYFDDFVEEWKRSGGDTITEEVNEWYRDQ